MLLQHGKEDNIYSTNTVNTQINVKGIKQVYSANNCTIKTDGAVAYLYFEKSMSLSKGEQNITTISSTYSPVGLVEDFVMQYNCKIRLNGSQIGIINMSGAAISTTTIKAWITYLLANPLY